ncbi:hypothetical protein ASPZODRAFT_129505 [Penicilliopsis zonata CBS 506.65]|uniref:Ribosome maturation protein SDO1/SBDS N-terminal domain-containing protein n=1 Tax=Penicilliopsis zonata CBS 506.65 TaxID=1073090 RepID=A0A1L9SPE3_9EURO|nr:hypothetical protein ASPZODRAFT_129505 [Penicilliopsis zonata CBS 506.65]OJJ49105.1 hypothetical protein ASPZODRAFT_129505 [Penicilliopsis zonata CBS 506.65]
MPRSNDNTSKIFYKGRSDDFVVFVDDLTTLNNWRKDKSVPLTDVVNGWKIFVTHKHGAQGVLDGASNASLENEFGTANEDDCMVKILEGGEYQNSPSRESQGDRNISKGPSAITR